jgi:hypothetical protein
MAARKRHCTKWGRGKRGRRVCRRYSGAKAKRGRRERVHGTLRARCKRDYVRNPWSGRCVRRGSQSFAIPGNFPERRAMAVAARRAIVDPLRAAVDAAAADVRARYPGWYMPPDARFNLPGFRTRSEYETHEIREVSEILARNQGLIP